MLLTAIGCFAAVFCCGVLTIGSYDCLASAFTLLLSLLCFMVVLLLLGFLNDGTC